MYNRYIRNGEIILKNKMKVGFRMKKFIELVILLMLLSIVLFVGYVLPFWLFSQSAMAYGYKSIETVITMVVSISMILGTTKLLENGNKKK